jgi:hypothetical protein
MDLSLSNSKILHFLPSLARRLTNAFPGSVTLCPNSNGDPIILLDYYLSRVFRGGTYPRMITSSVDEVTQRMR